ncbi:hypothetical protein IE81DRAFT_323708 [Ceraceosorus guamensis]|uniref:Meiotically up-regulated protein Msb1/Mug8 domain-containing protein n=1 Tax=Ceraceosorus guamensis TaxID=1522189 RepID=A0A316W3R5_9BASI|nr:hypothetical protein IE81DRAFT_323708 [Ceraceosorus guamensis]PWN42225.1 hypothetical protein IE81DRAFT_323708 [Ceraceosorus guamensis]
MAAVSSPRRPSGLFSRFKAGLSPDDSSGAPYMTHKQGVSSIDYEKEADAAAAATGAVVARPVGISRRVSSRNFSTPDLNGPTKSKRGFWGRKHVQEASPPVPDLPPSLSLAFQQEEDAKQARKANVENAFEEAQPAIASADPAQDKAASLWTSRRKKADASATAQGPSPAAALVLATKAKPATATEKLGAHRNARLDIKQAKQLCSLCSKEIRMRGLGTVGIFRPFRLPESPERVERLVELFLLHIDPHKYEGIFTIAPQPGDIPASPGASLMMEMIGKTDALSELQRNLSYANVHDVVALFKWALRRLRLRTADFNSAEQFTWYEAFVEAEKAADYPAKAWSDILLPSLPKATAEFLTELFDLFTTISAHHVANAMPASRLARTLSYWIWGRISADRPPTNLEELFRASERSAGITEHLLLAHIRNQAATIHLMPTRLTELVQKYPYIAEGTTTPSLPPPFAAAPHFALRVDVKSENVSVNPRRPRGPNDTFRAACKAIIGDTDSSAEVDDWTALVAYATNAPGPAEVAAKHAVDGDATTDSVPASARLAGGFTGALGPEPSPDSSPVAGLSTLPLDLLETDEESDIRRESALSTPEDARVLRIVATILGARQNILDPLPTPTPEMPPAAQPDPWNDETMLRKTRSSNPSVYGSIASRPGTSMSSVPPSRSVDSAMSNGMSEPASNWLSASESGAGLGLSRSVSASSALGTSSNLPPSSSLRGLGSIGALGTLREDDGSPSQEAKDIDWADFSSIGFGRSVSQVADLSLTDVRPMKPAPEPEEDQEGGRSSRQEPPMATRSTSFGSLRRRGTKSRRPVSRESDIDSDFGMLSPSGRSHRAPAEPAFSVTKVSTMPINEGFVSMWQDQLLDAAACASFSPVLIVQLNQKAASRILTPGMGTPTSSWLCIEETIAPPRPALPSSPSAGGRMFGGHAKRDSINGDAASERRSLFAPSFKSVTASIYRRAGLRRMASLLSVRGGASSSGNQPSLPKVRGSNSSSPLGTPTASTAGKEKSKTLTPLKVNGSAPDTLLTPTRQSALDGSTDAELTPRGVSLTNGSHSDALPVSNGASPLPADTASINTGSIRSRYVDAEQD